MNLDVSTSAVTTSEWTEWSECTESCGNGTQFRTKGCAEGDSHCETDSRPCNTQDCNPEPDLKGEKALDCSLYIIRM